MAVYYKFKSAKDYDSIPTDGHFISLANLKEKVFELKKLGRGTDFDLVVTNAQTNEEYVDEAVLIPRNTSVLVRRVPGRPRMPIVTGVVITHDMPKVKDSSNNNDTLPAKSSFLGADSSAMDNHEDPEWDEFGNDLYAIPEVLPVQASNPIQHAPPPGKDDEDSKIDALIRTPALDWHHQASDGFGRGRGSGRGLVAHGFGRGGLDWKTPPQGYVCHRCKVPGHFIQHCPTNGDHNFDLKRVKPPTGIPKSMLMTTSDGSYALPSGAVAVLKPNEAAFEKEMEGLPSTRSVGDLPAELHCPLCKDVMKDAVLTSKCCFNSFCDTCIRDRIISKSVCVCGATNVLADDLLPNKTLRDTINRILESNNSSAENAGSTSQVQDMESKIPKPTFPSSTSSATSKGEQAPPPQSEETSKVQESGEVANAPKQTSEEGRIKKIASASGVMHNSMSAMEPASQGSVPMAKEVFQQKPLSVEPGKKKKKKKDRMPLNAAEIQWDAADNTMMSLCPLSYNPRWNGTQARIDGYVSPYGDPLPYMSYGLGPFDVPFGFLPQDPFVAQGYMMPPVPPQMHASWRELSKGRQGSREVGSSGNASSLKSEYVRFLRSKFMLLLHYVCTAGGTLGGTIKLFVRTTVFLESVMRLLANECLQNFLSLVKMTGSCFVAAFGIKHTTVVVILFCMRNSKGLNLNKSFSVFGLEGPSDCLRFVVKEMKTWTILAVAHTMDVINGSFKLPFLCHKEMERKEGIEGVVHLKTFSFTRVLQLFSAFFF
ncbi:E3 ubiquitin ligase PQT3-like isoform X3 [Rhododendron vialii]|uniref:E3 ubiquitin ligase PQT3-like isoform X3 n=1 Tax=Rhododendron vialii TaxID=182163 RepID=UPI00266006E5|nr:E3 ubiquitin ligase PQT3-like isoform X3 [Rhododendron vialii]